MIENSNKKTVFEPVSAEEAKKIRGAFTEKNSNKLSGIECPSGGDFIYEPCIGKYEGAICCFHSGANDIYGVCVNDESGPTAYTLRCATDPSHFPPDWPDWPDPEGHNNTKRKL